MRKMSGKQASACFKKKVEEIEGFLDKNDLPSFSKANVTWAYEYAIIRLYREFEDMILNCLVAAINNDASQLSKTTGVKFQNHLTKDVCEFIIVGDGYFDFRGRDGLINTLKKYIPKEHDLVKTIKNPHYQGALEKLSALRNFAVHDSKVSKKRALHVINAKRLASSGAWLKKKEKKKEEKRFRDISTRLKELADEINKEAPY